MKKLVKRMIGISVIWSMSTILFAATIGNPVPNIGTNRWQVSVELENWDKDMDAGLDLEGTKLLTKVSYGAADNISFFGRLGIAEIEAGTAQSGNDFAFGLGAKMKVYEDSNMKVGVITQVLMFSGDMAGDDFDYTEFEVACGVTHPLTDVLTGYAGLSICLVKIDFDHSENIDEDDPFYFFTGVEFAATKDLDLGFEMKVVGESSLTVLANYHF